MASATAALDSLHAHQKVVQNERQQMKDDIAFLRDLRRRYTLPLSELPPCRGLPAPVASSARKFLVDTEAYIMRRMSASQAQAAEISAQAEQLRDTINQTASMAHAIAGTQPTPYAYAPGTGAAGALAAANSAAVSSGGGGGGGGGTLPYYTSGGGGGVGAHGIQTPSTTIGFSDPLMFAGGSPGGASRFSGMPNYNNRGGAGNGGGGGGGFSGISPMPAASSASSAGGGGGGGGMSGPEIRFEAPMGVLPFMTAASAAYRQQQALAYLAADQNLLPRGWQPAPMNAQPLVPYGMNGVGAGGAGAGAGSARGGLNVSPSRMRANEMSGAGGDTTFVVLPRSGSVEPRARISRKPSFRPVR